MQLDLEIGDVSFFDNVTYLTCVLTHPWFVDNILFELSTRYVSMSKIEVPRDV